jgi:hypothetical protein
MEALTGQAFNGNTAISFSKKTKHNKAVWLFKCHCGKYFEAIGSIIKNGHQLSCGCLQHKTQFKKTHGKTNTPEFAVWHAMRHRCKNKRFKRYGGRGISVCERWNSFANFLDDIGERPSPNHSIERIDNNLGYFKENCRWATPEDQANNRITNKIYEINGTKNTLAQWCRFYNIRYGTVCMRIHKYGWGIRDALTRPIRYKKK